MYAFVGKFVCMLVVVYVFSGESQVITLVYTPASDLFAIAIEYLNAVFRASVCMGMVSVSSMLSAWQFTKNLFDLFYNKCGFVAVLLLQFSCDFNLQLINANALRNIY